MSELPKIALKRLRAGASTAKAGTGPGAFQGSEHPDANLLAAFAEQSLSGTERGKVLEHLGHCTECREVAALLLPADAEGAVVRQATPERHWNLWPVLRWGSLIAALGVVTVVVGLHSNLWRGSRESTVSRPPAGSDGKISEPLQAYAPAPSPVNVPRDKAAAEEGEQEKAALQKRSEEMASRDHLGTPAKKEVSRMATSQAPAGLHIENATGAGISRRESLGDRAISAPTVQPPVVAAAPPQPPAPSAQPASPASAAMTSADQANPPQTVQTEVEGPMLQSENKQQGGLAGGAEATSASAPGAAKPTAQVGEQSKTTARGGMFGMMAARRTLKATAPAVVWNVSGNGKLQHSTDGAKSFAAVEVIPGIKFTAVAAMGDEVWAGGENGALFHSLDAGASWAQVKIGPTSNTVQEAISAVQFSPGGKLVLVTASGVRWMSNDDGQNWTQIP
jgi:hypothetical protein